MPKRQSKKDNSVQMTPTKRNVNRTPRKVTPQKVKPITCYVYRIVTCNTTIMSTYMYYVITYVNIRRTTYVDLRIILNSCLMLYYTTCIAYFIFYIYVGFVFL